MIEKKIVVCIGTDEARHIRARLSLLQVDGDQVISRHYHSIEIDPGADLAFVRRENERNLADPKGGIPGAPWPKIPNAEWADVEEHVGIIHKPAVVTAFRARQAELAAEQKAREVAIAREEEKRKAADQQRFREAVAEEVAKLAGAPRV